jgi:putative hydrolase of the HAD superfamily
MNAIGFDFGNTLMEYTGVPLNWEQHYPAALHELARFLGAHATSEQIDRGCAVLRRFNTRLNPREHEVSFATILAEVQACFGADGAVDEDACAAAFFRVFQQHLSAFADAAPALAKLRARDLRLGIFTDVPYGMPRSLVLQDVRDAGLEGAFDVLLTSRDAGHRKPAAAAIRALADSLGCGAANMAYVGDERKDVEAARNFGCTAILLDRQRHGVAWGQDRTIASLAEL